MWLAIGKGCPGPHFFNLRVAVQRSAVGSDTVDRAHFALGEFAHVGVVDLVQRGDAHRFRNQVAQSGEVGVPLAGQLLGHDGLGVLALHGVAEVGPGPQLLHIGLRRRLFRVRRRLRCLRLAQLFGHARGGFERGQIETAGVGALAGRQSNRRRSGRGIRRFQSGRRRRCRIASGAPWPA